MPSRYEREIEEILRNMDRAEPRQGLGDRIRAFNRPRRSRGPRTLLNMTEVLLAIGIALALAAAGLVYYNQLPTTISGVLGLAAFACIVLGLAVAWVDRFRRPRVTQTWRGTVVDMTPRRRNPFTFVATRLRILGLKLRYRRHRERE
jgi:hypothetical protein